MRAAFTQALFGAALGVALAGCPDAPPDPQPDAGDDAGVTLSPVEMCDRMAAARCALLSRCFAAFAREPQDACLTLEQARCLDRYAALKPAFESGAVEINEGKVVSCEERMAASACPPSFPPGYPADIATAYSDCTLDTGLLRGNTPSGQTCDQAVECAQGTVCVKPGGVCLGTCSSSPRAGEPCGFGCAPGLYCDGKGTAEPIDDRCAPPKGANEPCESSVECAEDLWCNATCRPRGAEGDPCRFDPQRLSTCQAGLACDVLPWVQGEVGTCVVPRPKGGACKYHWSCQGGLICFDLDWTGFPMSAAQHSGVCAAPTPAQQICPYTPYALYVGDPCQPGLVCAASTNTCAGRPALGEACEPFSQACAGQNVYCKPSESAADLGTCTGPAGLNERCASRLDDGQVIAIPCQSGFCDTQTTLKCLPPSKQIGQVCTSGGECLSGRCAVQEDRTLRCAAAC
jgi:hypothetical protein